ncbi:hypothetical protein FEZ51_04895 [Pediococcus stilesii]|uniref:Uncharacterized protein n=1 Tax=Pediococcus stilesii TaxID=331679 RepID=A0A5R9BX04_9LACO|nr:hypothetical protein [Pediococcus stilesii]TLQ04402.1 hypothetical protein FEZ51_04895 [Pediococcus stilesii]
MKIKILLKYGLIGAVLIAIFAVAIIQLHLTSDLTNRLVESAGLLVFLILGILLKKKEINKN